MVVERKTIGAKALVFIQRDLLGTYFLQFNIISSYFEEIEIETQMIRSFFSLAVLQLTF